MPMYEYQCEKCSHVTTFLESADSKEPHVCEACGSRHTHKLLSTFAVSGSSANSGSSQSASGMSCPTGTCPFAQ